MEDTHLPIIIKLKVNNFADETSWQFKTHPLVSGFVSKHQPHVWPFVGVSWVQSTQWKVKTSSQPTSNVICPKSVFEEPMSNCCCLIVNWPVYPLFGQPRCTLYASCGYLLWFHLWETADISILRNVNQHNLWQKLSYKPFVSALEPTCNTTLKSGYLRSMTTNK